jgi:hypothetical protein
MLRPDHMPKFALPHLGRQSNHYQNPLFQNAVPGGILREIEGYSPFLRLSFVVNVNLLRKKKQNHWKKIFLGGFAPLRDHFVSHAKSPGRKKNVYRLFLTEVLSFLWQQTDFKKALFPIQNPLSL